MITNNEKKQTEIDPTELGEIFYTNNKKLSYSYETYYAFSYYSFFKSYILPLLPADKKVKIFDVGCGGGYLLYALREEGYLNCCGIDSSKKQIDIAKEKMDCVELADAFGYLPAHQKEFDVITLIDVAEHLNRDDLFKLLKMINMALRPGGILILHTLNGLSPFTRPFFFGDPTHQQIYSFKIVGEYALLAGFKEYHEFPAIPERFPKAKSIDSVKAFVRFLLKIIRWFLWHLMSRVYGLIEWIAVGTYRRFYTPNFIIVCKKST